jgi:hypothetical protein
MGEWSRRGFLGLLGTTVAATAAALELDPEKLLWVPGRKTIFLPAKEVHLATSAEVERFLHPEQMGERYRLDVASNRLGEAGHTSLYFNQGWQLLRADRHHLAANGRREREENIQLSPEGLMVLEAELGERLSSYARVGCEKQHGLSHRGGGAGAGSYTDLSRVATRTRLATIDAKGQYGPGRW